SPFRHVARKPSQIVRKNLEVDLRARAPLPVDGCDPVVCSHWPTRKRQAMPTSRDLAFLRNNCFPLSPEVGFEVQQGLPLCAQFVRELARLQSVRILLASREILAKRGRQLLLAR